MDEVGKMKRAIISGAGGFIGTNLTKQLLAAGVEVFPTDGFASDELPYGADVFYHLAWKGMAPAHRNDFEMQYWNIEHSLYNVRLAASLGVKKFVLPGSTFEYLHHYAPINELAVPSPVNAYGSTKLAVRFLCGELATQLGLGLIYTVITGVYSADRRDGNVIYYVIDELLNSRKPSLTSLEQRWDYIHINDVCKALHLVGEKGKPGRFYSIGSGDNIPLRDYIFKIRDLIDPCLPLGIGEKPNGGKLTSSCIDLTALSEDTGFVPDISFDKGIREVIEALKREQK